MKSRYLLYICVALLAVTACEVEPVMVGYREQYVQRAEVMERVSVDEERHVLLLYSVGFNNLSRYLREDIQDLWDGWLPGEGRQDDVLLIYSHAPKADGDYATPNSPVLYKLYRGADDSVVSDTLVVYDENARSATAEQLNAVLAYVNETYPAKSYGMVFSSHATGYLPAGYYSSPTDFTFDWGISYRFGHRDSSPKPVPYVEQWRDPSLPAVKSIGQDLVGPYGSRVSYEIELSDFAAAIPMHMEYILFDACLMGGVEVAYELKDKCDYIGFSPTEVLSEGFNYKTLTSNLLGEDRSLRAVCEDYYNQYIDKTGASRSATISLVDCSGMDALAECCAGLFRKYRTGLDLISPVRVQQYYTYSYHWFYDLESIISESGRAERYHLESSKSNLQKQIDKAVASEDQAALEELEPQFAEVDARLQEIMLTWDEHLAELTADIQELRKALTGCIVYKAATPEFLIGPGGFRIYAYSGLSMYLPCNGGENLDKYYKTLGWNISTGLVK